MRHEHQKRCNLGTGESRYATVLLADVHGTVTATAHRSAKFDTFPAGADDVDVSAHHALRESAMLAEERCGSRSNHAAHCHGRSRRHTRSNGCIGNSQVLDTIDSEILVDDRFRRVCAHTACANRVKVAETEVPRPSFEAPGRGFRVRGSEV